MAEICWVLALRCGLFIRTPDMESELALSAGYVCGNAKVEI